MKIKHKSCMWEKELKERGWERMLLSRLEFHGSLSIEMVMKYTKRCESTVRKHMNRLLEKGLAKPMTYPGGAWGVMDKNRTSPH